MTLEELKDSIPFNDTKNLAKCEVDQRDWCQHLLYFIEEVQIAQNNINREIKEVLTTQDNINLELREEIKELERWKTR